MTRRAHLPCVLLVLSSLFIPASTQSQNDRAPSTFPLTDAIADRAWPRHLWPPEVLHAVQHAYDCKSCSDVTARQVNFGALGIGAILTQHPYCPRDCSNLVVLYRFHGKYLAQQLDVAEIAYAVKSSGTVPDILDSSIYPCCYATVYRYTFSSAQGRFILSGCDYVGYPEDWGDIKSAEIKSCDLPLTNH